MEDDSVQRKLWRIKKTVIQLCHDRGYLVTPNELEETFDEFKELYKCKSRTERPLRARLTMLFTHSENDDKLFVYFPPEVTLRKTQIVSYCQEMQKENVSRAILVVQEALSPFSKKVISDLSSKFTLEVFWESELLINITDHEFVPKHIVLSNEEKEDLFNRYKLSENLLMRLQLNDPVARYYGLKRGQVVKIIRNSDTAGATYPSD